MESKTLHGHPKVANGLWTVFLLLLLLVAPSWADNLSLSKADQGQLSLPSGELYVPHGLVWSEVPLSGGVLLKGLAQKTSKTPTLVIASLDAVSEASNSEALKLFREASSQVGLSEWNDCEQLASATAPYPWADSLELTLTVKPSNTLCTVYVGSGSGRTLLIAAFGPESAELANSVAASFKENLNVKRQTEVRQGKSARIQSMLGTSSTFLIAFGLLFPLGLVLYTNRRRQEQRNPYKTARWGILAGVLLSILFDGIVLSRFSWTGPLDYGEAIGGVMARGIFTVVVVSYFSRRWTKDIDPPEQ